MMGPQIALHFEGDKLTAVHCVPRGEGVEVVAWATATKPSEVVAADPAGFGAWLADELKRAKLYDAARRGGIVFSASRGEVVLKRIVVPPGADESEMPGLVRLQMVRQMTLAGEAAGIDYLPLGTGTGGGSAVLAAAMPPERMAWRRGVAAAAGVRLKRVSLSAEGTARLMSARSHRRPGATLCVSLGAGGTELVVVEHGRMVFARGIDVARPDAGIDPEPVVAALVVEARRTWMSYRVAPESAEIEAVAVLGLDGFAAAVAENLGAALEMPAEACDYPPEIVCPGGMGAEARSALAPLAGLLALGTGAGLDFVSPRKPVPVWERRRRAVLVGALACVLSAGTAYTLARRELSARQDELDSLRSAWAETRDRHAVFLRDKARLEHAECWMSAKPDWVAHLNFVTLQMPDPSEAHFEKISGNLTARAEFELPKDSAKTYSTGKWRSNVRITMGISGPSKSREVSDPIRDRFKRDSVYEPTTPGPDVADRFDYVLTTAVLAPPVVAPIAPTGAAQDDGPPGGEAPGESPPADGARRNGAGQ